MTKHKKWLVLDVGLLVVIPIMLYSIYNTGKANALANYSSPIKLTIQCSEKLVLNNSVGNEWRTVAGINNNRIEIGEDYTLNVDIEDDILIGAGAEELDSFPDQGFDEKKIKVSDLSLTKTNNIPLEVTVVENRGRYSGNNAVWIFDFKITRELSFSDILEEIF